MSKYDDYGYRDPRRDPDAKENREHPQRRKKKTGKWCKGKVGVPHKPVIEFDRRYENGYSGRMTCGWTKTFFISDRGRMYWRCLHHEVCSVCGKHLRWRLKPAECPDYQKLTRTA